MLMMLTKKVGFALFLWGLNGTEAFGGLPQPFVSKNRHYSSTRLVFFSAAAANGRDLFHHDEGEKHDHPVQPTYSSTPPQPPPQQVSSSSCSPPPLISPSRVFCEDLYATVQRNGESTTPAIPPVVVDDVMPADQYQDKDRDQYTSVATDPINHGSNSLPRDFDQDVGGDVLHTAPNRVVPQESRLKNDNNNQPVSSVETTATSMPSAAITAATSTTAATTTTTTTTKTTTTFATTTSSFNKGVTPPNHQQTMDSMEAAVKNDLQRADHSFVHNNNNSNTNSNPADATTTTRTTVAVQLEFKSPNKNGATHGIGRTPAVDGHHHTRVAHDASSHHPANTTNDGSNTETPTNQVLSIKSQKEKEMINAPTVLSDNRHDVVGDHDHSLPLPSLSLSPLKSTFASSPIRHTVSRNDDDSNNNKNKLPDQSSEIPEKRQKDPMGENKNTMSFHKKGESSSFAQNQILPTHHHYKHPTTTTMNEEIQIAASPHLALVHHNGNNHDYEGDEIVHNAVDTTREVETIAAGSEHKHEQRHEKIRQVVQAGGWAVGVLGAASLLGMAAEMNMLVDAALLGVAATAILGGGGSSSSSSSSTASTAVSASDIDDEDDSGTLSPTSITSENHHYYFSEASNQNVHDGNQWDDATFANDMDNTLHNASPLDVTSHHGLDYSALRSKKTNTGVTILTEKNVSSRLP